ncbi:hypothetical protein PQR63_07600 [Herbaspirillum rhizosphaerae]|uniref:DUF1311 domain-containing protein n=1 Tax=Herbaspirillum rhizosphaerae TaxID=346179 RepID=A0ABW8Z7J2_9BURK
MILRKHIPFIFALISSFAYASTECNEATSPIDMENCAKKKYEKSLSEFKDLTKAISASTMLSKKSKAELISYYKKAAKIAEKVCFSTYTGVPVSEQGSLSFMYAWSCTSNQLDLLAKSKKFYICMQEDIEECHRGGPYDPYR